MTTSQQDGPRTNRLGHPCPDWCRSAHDFVHSHIGSAPPGRPRGRAYSVIYQTAPQWKPTVTVIAGEGVITGLTDLQAGWLADLLDGLVETGADLRQLAADMRQLAGDIRADAAVVRQAVRGDAG